MASNNEDIKWLYDKLKAKGYNIGSEDEFTNSLANEEDRQWYYDKATGLGLNMGSIDDFNELYAPKTESRTKEAPAEAAAAPATSTVHTQPQVGEFARQQVEQFNQAVNANRAEMFKQPALRDEIGGIKAEKYNPDAVAAMERAYKSFEPKTIDEQIADIEKRIDQRQKELYNEKSKQGPTASFVFGAGAAPAVPKANINEDDQELRSLIAARDQLKEAKEAKKLGDADVADNKAGNTGLWGFFKGAGRGFASSVFDVATWDFGVSDLSNNTQLLEVAQKAERGDKLTQAEEDLLTAASINAAAQSYLSEVGGYGTTAGKITGESLPFMLEFAINPLSGSSSSIAKYGAKKFGVTALKKGIGKKLAKAGLRTAGDVAAAAGMTATTGATRVAADATQRMTGNIIPTYDEFGYIQYGGREGAEDNVASAVGKAAGSNIIENYSELLGAQFAPMLNAGGKFAKDVAEKVGLKKATEIISDISGSNFSKGFRGFLDKTQWHGPIGEYFEEVASNILNAAFVGDMKFDASEEGVFNLENNIDTFLGVALMGGAFSAINTVGYAVEKADNMRVNRQLKNQSVRMSEMLGDKWTGIKDQIDSAEDEQLKALLAEITVSSDYTDEQKQGIWQYAAKLKASQGANMVRLEQQIGGEFSPELNDVMESYDAGYKAQLSEAAAIKAAYDDAVSAYEQKYEPIGDDINYAITEAIDVGDTERRDALVDVAKKRAAYEGIKQQARDNAEDRIAASNMRIDRLSNQGNIISATLKDGDKPIYITSGNVQVNSDNTLNISDSSSFMVAQTPEGEIITVSPDQILRIDAISPASEQKYLIEQMIWQEEAQNIANVENGSVSVQPGETYTVINDYGEPIDIQVIRDNMDGTYLINDGMQNVNMNAGQLQQMLQQSMVVNARTLREEQEAHRQQQNAAAVESAPVEQVEQPVIEQLAAEETATEQQPQPIMVGDEFTNAAGETGIVQSVDNDGAVITWERADGSNYTNRMTAEDIAAMQSQPEVETQPAEMPAVAESAVPSPEELQTTEQAQTTVAQTPESVLAEMQDFEPEEKQTIVNNNIHAAEQAYNDILNAKPVPGTDIAAFRQEKAEWQANVDQASANLDFWNSVNALLNAPAAEEAVAISEETQPEAPVSATAEAIAQAEAETNTEPTEAQKEAGNYKKGHVVVDGLNITIEQPKGSVRRGTDANGKEWDTVMNNTYGYIRGTQSVDGDHIDIFLSDNPETGNVYVVDQVNNDGSFDEHKVMYGFNSVEEARAAYLSNYEEGWQGLGNITEVSKEDFKKWIDSSTRKTKPFAEYASTPAPAVLDNYTEGAPQDVAEPWPTSEYMQTTWQQARKEVGMTDDYTLPNGETIEGVYVLTEADALSPSHNPNAGFSKTEGFPVDENGNTINDRDYEFDKEAQAIVSKKAQDYDQRAVQTPVIVTGDGIVISGNDRTMSGQMAAQMGTDGKYISYITNRAAKFGFTPEQVSSFNHPRIVFVPTQPIEYNAKTFAKFNAEDKKTQNKTEQAVKMGKTISDNGMMQIAEIINNFETMSELYANQAAVSDIINILQREGVIVDEQRAQLFDGNTLSAIGKDLLENVLVGGSLSEESVRSLNQMKDVRSRVVKAILQVLTNRTLGEYSLTGEISDAIEFLYKARKSGVKDNETTEAFARQPDLFGGKPSEIYSATVQMIANALNRSGNLFKNFLNQYNERASSSASGQLDMFTGDVESKEQIINNILDVLYGKGKRTFTTEKGGTDSQRDAVSNANGGPKEIQSGRTDEAEVAASELQESVSSKSGYTIEQAQYTTKRGKVLNMQLVKFDRELTKEEFRKAKELAKSLKGWWDSKQGGFMMRSKDDAMAIVNATPSKDENIFQTAERIAREEKEKREMQLKSKDEPVSLERWHQMGGDERMEEAEKHPLSREETENSTTDEVLKANALDYLNGNQGMIQSISYLKVYEDVRYSNGNFAADSGATDSTQLDEARNGSQQGLDGSTGGPGRIPSEPMDTKQGEGNLPGQDGYIQFGANSQELDSAYTGKESDSPISGEEQSVGGLPVRSGERGGSGGSGSNGRNGKQGRAGRSDKSAENDRKRGAEAKRGRNIPNGERKRVDEDIDTFLSDAIKEFDSVLDEFKSAGNEELSASLIGLSNRQLEVLPRLIASGAKVGYAYIRKGVYNFAEWAQQMRAVLGAKLVDSGLSDNEVDAFIREMWKSRLPMDGKTHTLEEWAGILGKEELRKKVGASLAEKRKAQQAAEAVSVINCDRGNIAETLPFLLPQQQDDVLKAETQFFDESHNDREHAFGKGYMFTNGTGTGKTYTGLGIVKRFIKQGKGRILILTPSQTKVGDWIKDAANLDIDLKDLDAAAKARKNGATAITEKGDGAVVTTYANFRQNKALLEDLFDLIVYDESHRLLENKGGIGTAGAMQHYKISNRNEQFAFLRLQEINPVWNDYQSKLNEFNEKRDAHIERLKKERGITNELTYKIIDELPPVLNGKWTAAKEKQFPELYKLQKEISALYEKYDNEIKPELEQQVKKNVKHTKVVFLSATPFNTRENLDYTEGYIFSYPENEKPDGYSAQSPRSQFYLEHFGAGYRWRYHRLESTATNPEAVSKQEVEFSDYLQHTLQTMSGRIIDSPFDYSRDFPTVTLDKAEEFNNAMEELSHEEATWEAYHKVMGDYNYAGALFESMKVAQIIPRLKEHLARGRKAVVFHRRVETKKPLVPPFHAIFEEAVKILEGEYDATKKAEKKQKIAALRRKYSGMLEWEQTLDLRMPREQLADAFGYDNVLFFSGKESKKSKDKAVEEFNSDTSGKNIIVIQESSGKEGISLHDTTGKHQRVLVTLALPQSPITALQIEGRIYRIGNKSNAIFEYPLLGLNTELMLFGQKFNQQVSTTENLALGSQARNLRESFARGVEEHSGDVDIDSQGVGGKEFDAPSPAEKDAFDSAVLDYYTNQKLTGKRDSREGTDYYPTPEPLGFMMGQWGRIGEGESVLEPSAGHGAIARYVPRENQLTAIEPSQSLFSKLQIKAGGNGRKFENIIFEDYNIVNKHDVVLMNPPFGTGGRLAVDHVAKAFQHLDEGGRIVAIIPRGAADKKFDKWYDEQKNAVVTAEIDLPDITFERAGTSINCRVVIIDKVTNDKLREAAATRAVRVDLSERHYEKIEDFFEDIRNISVPERTIDRKAKLKKKAALTARELRAMKGVRSVRLDEDGLYVSGNGVWASIEWGERDANELTQFLADQYLKFKDNYNYAVRNERKLQEAVYDEMKDLTCRLAGMTEDEMQRYIDKSQEVSQRASEGIEDGDVRFRTFGGNSGYVGYSMSKRAQSARGEGRFPKTDFMKDYNIPANTLKALVDVGIINDNEWHHTSKFGNETTFYGWDNPLYAEFYEANKKEVDKKVKEFRSKKKPMMSDFRKEDGSIDFAALTEAEDNYNDEKFAIAEMFDNYVEKESIAEDVSEEQLFNDTVTESAVKMASSMNTDIRVVTNISELPEGAAKRAIEKGRKVKGWYDTNTGEVVLYLPNADSVEDARKTVFHEIVAHKGLREMLGDDFSTFLQNVFLNSNKKVRSKIVALASANNWNIETATEEYLATLAENGFDSEAERSYFQRIKDTLIDLLRKAGIRLGFKLSDKELRYILWRSYQMQQNKGIVGEAENVAMQSVLKVGNYAPEGDVLFRDSTAAVQIRDDYERKVSGFLNNLDEAYHDYLRSVRIAQDLIVEKSGTKIQDYEDVYKNAMRKSSMDAVEVREFHEKMADPFLKHASKMIDGKIIDGRKMTSEHIDKYLHLLHAPERNEVFARRDARRIKEEEIQKLDKQKAAGLITPADYNTAKSETEAKEQDNYKKFRENDYSGLTEMFGEGKTVQELEALAKEYTDKFEQIIGQEDIDILHNDIKQINHFILNKTYESGIISRNTMEELETMFEHYVPLRGFKDDVASDVYEYVGSEANANDRKIVKSAKGRKSTADSPIANLLVMGTNAIVAGNKNKLVKMSLLNLAENHPTDLLTVSSMWYEKQPDGTWEPKVADIPENATAKEVAQIVEAFEEDMKTKAKAKMARRRTGKSDIPLRVLNKRQEMQHAVRVMRNGTEYVVYINGNPKLAQAVNGLLNIDSTDNPIWKTARALNGFFARLNTSWSPEFIARNLARDIVASSITAAVKEGPKYTAMFEKNLMNSLSPIGVKGVRQGKFTGMYNLYVRYKNGKLDMNNPRDRYFNEFIKNGGETGITQMLTIDSYKNKMKKMVDKNGFIEFENATKAVWSSIVGGVDFLNKGVENACRFSAYMTSRQLGKSITESIYDAKEISVNFNRKGSGAMGNRLFVTNYMFFNAAMQGLFKQIDLFKKYPAKMSGLAFGLSSIAFLMALICINAGDDGDDEEMPGYFDINPFTRRGNFMVPIGDGKFAKIPLAYEVAAWYGMGDILATTLYDEYNRENTVTEIGMQLASMLPLDVVEGKNIMDPERTFLEQIGKAFIPSYAKPFAEAWGYEQDFLGRPINNRTDFNKQKPEWMRAKKSTSKFFIGLSKGITEITGGSKYKKGSIDNVIINPGSMEHLTKNLSGGFGTFIINSSKTVQALMGEEDYKDAFNVPFARSFYMNLDNEYYRNRRINDRWYYYVTESESLDFNFKMTIADPEIPKEEKDALKESYRQNGELEIMKVTKAYSKADKKYTDRIKEAEKSGNDELVDKLYEMQSELRRKAVNKIDSIVEDHK